jgi:hypothetical protein
MDLRAVTRCVPGFWLGPVRQCVSLWDAAELSPIISVVALIIQNYKML